VRRAAGSELRAFLGGFSPEIARIALRLRGRVLEQAPMAHEFISDTPEAAAMSYGLTDRPEDSFCRIAVYAGWVTLGFPRGAPPTMRIASLDDLREPAVGRSLRAAMQAAAPSGSDTGRRSTARPVVRGVYAKKSPGKPASKKETA
jgi:hypothetical protein